MFVQKHLSCLHHTCTMYSAHVFSIYTYEHWCPCKHWNEMTTSIQSLFHASPGISKMWSTNFFPSKLTEIQKICSTKLFKCLISLFKDTKKVDHILESSLDIKSGFDALNVIYKSKTIFMPSLNSHVYWDTLHNIDTHLYVLLYNCTMQIYLSHCTAV